ncbi:MAG: IS3 family transposase [Acidimicrobiales bacterium]|jgi:transposase InsO family protein
MPKSYPPEFRRCVFDRRRRQSKAELASAIFEWIEAFYNPIRRHTSIEDLGPVEFESRYSNAEVAA